MNCFEQYCGAKSFETRKPVISAIKSLMNNQEEPVVWLLTSFEMYLGGKIDDFTIRKLIKDFQLLEDHEDEYWKWRRGYLKRRRIEAMDKLKK